MKKKIILKRIFHRGAWRYAIIFDYDKTFAGQVRSIENVTWSHTNKCWYAPGDESTLKQILAVFREWADIDISAIVSGEESAKKTVQPFVESDSLIQKDNEEVEKVNNLPEEERVIEIAAKKQDAELFGPVQFAISETDGRLVIKFLGHYDPEWIRELRSYGKLYYDSVHMEWLLRWSQITVDSLSDYFSYRGIKVIVVKRSISPKLKEIRSELGNEIRERILSASSVEAIELVRNHLEEKRYSKRTTDSYLAHLDLFFRYFHDKDPEELDEKDISNFIEDYILKPGYSASYQNIMISAIKMYYSVCTPRRLHLDSIERPRRNRSLPKVFSKEEVLKIFDATKNNKHKLILWLIYSCGLRRSEVINIKLTDLDTERGVLHIREGKGNIDRIVPIAKKVWDKIQIYIKGYKPITYLFEGQSGGRYSVESVYSVFKQSLKRAGIQKDVGVHCLRHSYATHLHESGLDIRYIQALLGHKSSRTTEIYTHISRRNLFAIRSPIEDMDIE